MRVIDPSAWSARPSARLVLRSLRLAAVVAGIGLVMAAGVARAEDPEEDEDATFEDKLIKNIMTGIGGTNMDNRGITYRERSPLVVPPKLDLPPPETGKTAVNLPNWPKDPDAAERKRIKDLNKQSKATGVESARPLMPNELAAGKTKPTTATEPLTPGNSANNPVLSPSQLGYTGGIFSTMFGGPTVETAPFTGEPTRETLTQPPVGYQTPSPNYAYGTGPKESLNNQHVDVMTGKEVKN
ncbi:MAG TPA: hypothetical protein VGC77_02400 [Rhodopseudomonas sp.]|uniref:hypothetical protein n=1 Tax=Rhodopseudomonas sp. TaxID=1078 RepID=UPI002ED98C95